MHSVMPKYFVIQIICIAFVCSISAESHADMTDFRGTRWGMTRLEVMASEGKAPVSLREPYLYYRPEVLGQEFHLIYEFIENKLVEAVYIVVTRDHDDYRRLKNRIESNHGQPSSTTDTGNLSYRFVWESPSTEIIMRPGKLRECRIEYYGKQYKHLKSIRLEKARNTYLQEIRRSF